MMSAHFSVPAYCRLVHHALATRRLHVAWPVSLASCAGSTKGISATRIVALNLIARSLGVIRARNGLVLLTLIGTDPGFPLAHSAFGHRPHERNAMSTRPIPFATFFDALVKVVWLVRAIETSWGELEYNPPNKRPIDIWSILQLQGLGDEGSKILRGERG